MPVSHEVRMLQNRARNCVERASDQQVVRVKSEYLVKCGFVDERLVDSDQILAAGLQQLFLLIRVLKYLERIYFLLRQHRILRRAQELGV